MITEMLYPIAASLVLCLAGGLACTRLRAADTPPAPARVAVALAILASAALLWQHGDEYGPHDVSFGLRGLASVIIATLRDPEWSLFAAACAFNMAIVLAFCLAVEARIRHFDVAVAEARAPPVLNRTDEEETEALRRWERPDISAEAEAAAAAAEASDMPAGSWSRDDAQLAGLDSRIPAEAGFRDTEHGDPYASWDAAMLHAPSPPPPPLSPGDLSPPSPSSRAGITDLAAQGAREIASAGARSQTGGAARWDFSDSQHSRGSLTSEASSTSLSLSSIPEDGGAVEAPPASPGGGGGRWRFTPSRERRKRQFRRRWSVLYRAFRVWSARENPPPHI